MVINIAKSPMLISLLKQISQHMAKLSQHDANLHRLLQTLGQYIHQPNAVDGNQLLVLIENLKDVGSSYVGHDKNLPNLFWHAKTETEHLLLSHRLSNTKHAKLLLNIDTFAKHSVRKCVG